MAITVSELIHILEELPANALVVVASDAEGNSFSYLDAGTSQGFYDEDDKYFAQDEDFEDDYEVDLDDESPAFGPEKAVALWPED